MINETVSFQTGEGLNHDDNLIYDEQVESVARLGLTLLDPIRASLLRPGARRVGEYWLTARRFEERLRDASMRQPVNHKLTGKSDAQRGQGEPSKMPPDPAAVAAVMKAQNPGLTVRKAAESVGLSPSKLQKSAIWQTVASRVNPQRKGNIRSGSKTPDGQIETPADEQESADE